jgi:DNA-binding response OmpR family regulator
MIGNLLIVDDSLTVRADLAEAFAATGLNVIACENLAQARAVLGRETIRLAILDVLLPDGDGTELLAQIRAMPQGADMPILMLSSEAEVRDRIRGLSMGSNDYVGKPYDRDYVVARARELLGADPRDRSGGERPLILVVDDSLTFREQLADALRAEGYAVLTESTGEDGLRSVSTHRPAAVIVDGILPGIDGPSFIRTLRMDEALRQTPCILLTGANDQAAELRALESGADAFARKEADLDVLLAQVGAVLRSTAQGREREKASLFDLKKILAVDDSPTYLNELRGVLTEEGYDVILAHSGEEAIEMLAVQPVDCILLDRVMPGLSGTETCRRIKASPAVRDIPLIMLTATEGREAMVEGLATGADDYILKSSDSAVLKARVRAQLRRKQFEDESRRVRLELLDKELEAAQARAARQLAENRAELLAIVEQKNTDLQAANAALQDQQREIARKNAELLAANRAKSEFLSTMSHELRTPLNAILGFSEVLKDGLVGVLTHEQRDFIGHIYESGSHLLELINDILDLSKIEAGKVELVFEPVDVNAVLSDSVAMLRERALSHRVKLECERLPGGATLQADRRRLKQVVYNLLSNAIKFTPEEGCVRVTGRRVDRARAASALPGFAAGARMPLPMGPYDEFLELSVTDDGLGISQGDTERLFMPFTQIDNVLTREVEGTGLGLVTVYRLAEMHGGTVAVSSEPGKGSCFTAWLPWRGAASTTDDATEEVAARTERPLALVVEDNLQAMELMRLQLESAGFAVRCARSAEEALGWAGECTPAIITLDILLPGMDGWSFLARIRQIDAWRNVPVVVVSAVADRGVGLSLGAACVLQKPVKGADLVQELTRLRLGPSRTRRATVLIIDDDPDSVERVAASLDQQPGYNILRAYSGREGVELSQRFVPDLVVLDLLMPGMGGVEVVQSLKSNRATAGIPVIALTSPQLSPDQREQLNVHLSRVLDEADFRPEAFIAEVKRACAQRLP